MSAKRIAMSMKVRFGMLVEHPHDLRRVHRGAAAEGDDHVRLEGRHLLRAFPGAGKRRIGQHVEERLVRDAHLVELVGHRLGVAVFVEERIGHDKGALFAEHVFQFVQRDRQAASLEVDFIGRAEPEHILSPLGDGFDV